MNDEVTNLIEACSKLIAVAENLLLHSTCKVHDRRHRELAIERLRVALRRFRATQRKRVSKQVRA